MLGEGSIREEGSLKQFTLLFFPVALMTFSSCFFLFIEKLMLARLSIELMEAAISISYAVQIFQVPCMALAMMAQVFVARYFGSGDHKLIGPAIWQFIWFSFLSMIVTVPGSLIFAKFYFKGLPILDEAFPYFYLLISINFLFPLTTALSCFYLGQGKTRLLLWGTLGVQTVKTLLAFAFIFGIEGFIPSFGLIGGAISTCIAQAGLCITFLLVFLNKKHQNSFETANWKFYPKLFLEYTYPGLLRAFCRLSNFCSWSAIAHLMISRGGDYLLVLSLGGTFFMFLPFLGEAINQVQITIVSRLLGAKQYHLLEQAFRSGVFLCVIVIGILAIPFLCFPLKMFDFLFPNANMLETSVISLSIGIWLSFALFTYSMIPIGYILAFKDMNFSFFMGLFNWVIGFLFIYVAINFFSIPADQFWTVLSLMHATTGLLYYLRMKKLINSLEHSKPMPVH